MFKTDAKNLNERFGIKAHNQISATEIKDTNEDPSFLIEPVNLNKNYYSKKISDNNYLFPYFEIKNDHMTKTKSNFFNNYSYFRESPYINRNFINKDDIFVQEMKEKEKLLRIINQSYEENMKEEMKKDIKSSENGVNLNISNYETQEAINISNNHGYTHIKSKSADKCKKKRTRNLKSLFILYSNNSKTNKNQKNKYYKTQEKFKDGRKNLSNIHSILGEATNNKYNKTFSNFFMNNKEDKIEENIKRRNNNKQINEFCNYYHYSLKNKFKLFTTILEEYFVQSIKVFFGYFIHRLKIFIKLKVIRNSSYNSHLRNIIQQNQNISCGQISKNAINIPSKNSDKYKYKSFNRENRNKFLFTNLKKANIKNFPNYVKFKENKKRQVQFDQNLEKNKLNIMPKNLDVYFNKKNNSIIKSYQNLNKAINSNGLKSTNTSSNFQNSQNENVENKDSAVNKTITHTFNKNAEKYILNKTLKDKHFSSDNFKKNWIKNNNSITESNIKYNNRKFIIYKKPKLEDLKMFLIKKGNDFQDNKISSNNKDELPIKSIIIKKKNINKSFNSSLERKKIEANSDKIKDIIIKDIKSKDRRINIFIKYIISDKIINEFMKAKIRRKLIGLNNVQNIFLINDIDILKPIRVESFNFLPVITILKVNIKNNINDFIELTNEEKKKKLFILMNKLENLYQRYLAYFANYFLAQIENMNNDIKFLSNGNLLEENNELNDINISCISNKLKNNYENDVVIEENYSLNNDMDNILMNKNDKIETAKYLSDIGYINKMISPESSENENIINNNDNSNKISGIINSKKINNYDNELKSTFDNNCDNNKCKLKNNPGSETSMLKQFSSDSFGENKLFKINISKHKICKNILKDIGIKKDKITKEKLDKIKNIF